MLTSLTVGDAVTSYDPTSGKASVQTVQHTFINHDSNLLAVTLRTITSPAANTATVSASKQREAAVAAHGAHGAHGALAPPSSSSATHSTHEETIQTTNNHPWLTADHGWILASFLRVGEPVRRVDGSTAVVVAVRTKSGAAAMWDLTVSDVHTFAVGNAAYVVHNCPNGGKNDGFGDDGKPSPKDRLRGRDAKGGDKNIRRVANRLGMTRDERYGFGDYVEDLKHEVGAPNDKNFGWRKLLDHGRDFLERVRGPGWGE